MVALSSAAPFAAVQFGVLSIAAVLWSELHREERRRRRLRNVQTQLEDIDLRRSGEDHFKRAA
jgi:hypothetical protein